MRKPARTRRYGLATSGRPAIYTGHQGIDREAEELLLYADNTSYLHRRELNFIAAVQRKMKAGRYDPRLAPKLWMYYVDEAARAYVKQFGGDVRTQFPKKSREALAVHIARRAEENIRTKQYPDLTAPAALQAATRHLDATLR